MSAPRRPLAAVESRREAASRWMLEELDIPPPLSWDASAAGAARVEDDEDMARVARMTEALEGIFIEKFFMNLVY